MHDISLCSKITLAHRSQSVSWSNLLSVDLLLL